MSRFLRFIVQETLQGRAAQLKEYLIGVEVFDRDHSYDPRTDPVVRGEARRLRTKLMEYYENEGKEDVVRIQIPKGSYAVIDEKELKAAAPEATESVDIEAFVDGDAIDPRYFERPIAWCRASARKRAMCCCARR